MSVIEEVKHRVDIVEVIGSYVKLSRSGRNYKGLSPFQSERTPSFFVFPDTQTFKDFSSGEQGDVFSFLMKKEGWTFGEALRELARRAGVQLDEYTSEQQQSADHAARLRDALAQAAAYFHHLLLTAPQAAACRAYLREKRRLTDETIAAWQIGYSLADYHALTHYLTSRGFDVSELIDAGLVIENAEGRRYDRFRGRLMIPIHDTQGQVVGFGSRSLDGSEPKYMNSPQTAVFDKGRLLFGLHRARAAIRSEQVAVLVEGYMDVIGCHQAGFANVVAGMGTSLSEDQFRALKRLATRIVLALDADAAGDRAVLRGVEVAREAMDREAQPIFDPRGAIRCESKLKADIRVAVLPQGQDPDELVLESPERWREVVANARPVIEHVIDVVLRSRDVTDPHAKSQAARVIAPILLDASDPVQRDFYVQLLARRLQVSPRAVLAVVGQVAREARSKAGESGMRTQGAQGGLGSAGHAPSLEHRGADRSDLETHLIAALWRRPQLLLDANVALTRANLDVLDERDFTNPVLRAGFRRLSRVVMGAPLSEEEVEEEDWLTIIADYDALGLSAADEALLREEVVRTALRLRERNLMRDRIGINAMIEEAKRAHEADVAARYNLELHRVLTQHLRAQKALQLRSALNVT
ncbi:MAG: DNA primase [Chloroflexi bacterium]|jgi:DNA primase|uniref:DNA primase n=1 Tax=Candidatus Thermofonsia Clade 3 bacterium TaxID=2364212 RepID=A0A2M8QC65_9CHLR|nr:DNA primase [Candidatus Roseilinea sp. NK_OTU-006]PJF47396.1 MAG: DNA primase [Candidatus Thermofonsia Clade 3 bacterium]RMG65817.1 MAG: DNA primase [Chloroflexota bacterium]